MNAKLGIIGGTGFYEGVGIKEKERRELQTPFGEPSDAFIIGESAGREVVFLPRHGRGHTLIPTKVNYRANIWGMKVLGVTHVIGISAVGSFREEITPGSIVFIDQYFDRTKEQVNDTFFDTDIAIHIAFSDPICSCLHAALVDIAERLDVKYTPGGTYLNMEGPAFSTRAESRVYKSWGMAVIGMTNLYEAKLCREAEIHYATIAQVTDYDSWKEATVDVPTIMKNLKNAARSTSRVVEQLISDFPIGECGCNCHNALQTAVVSDLKSLSPALKKRYALLLDRYF